MTVEWMCKEQPERHKIHTAESQSSSPSTFPQNIVRQSTRITGKSFHTSNSNLPSSFFTISSSFRYVSRRNKIVDETTRVLVTSHAKPQCLG